jgi:hypothetical protein
MACIMKHSLSLLCQITVAKAINVKSTIQRGLIPDTRNSAMQVETIRILWAKNSGM